MAETSGPGTSGRGTNGTRSGASDDGARRSIAVVVAVHERATLMRPRRTPAGALLEFPGGHVEPGETPQEAAVREFEEETGTTPPTLTAGPVIDGDGARGPLRLHFFWAAGALAAPLDPSFSWEWIPVESLEPHATFPANRAIVEALRKLP